jgi:3-oxoadipate enol-lactonase
MPIIHVNDTELFYECVGQGPPLLLIHGLGSSADDWAFQRDEFARSHRLILPDLRGSGRSAKPKGPYSIVQFAADLWQLLDALGIEHIAILGFSLGGAVALEMALMQPGRVQRLVLCNALANYRTDTWRKWLEAHLQLALVRVLGLRRTARLIANRLFPHDEQAPKRQRVIDVVGANPRAAYLASMYALIGWSALQRLATLRCPTLIVAAEFDYTPLAEKRAEAARFPQMEFVVIEGSRHGTPFDATERFNACALDFLERTLPPGATAASPGNHSAVDTEELAGVGHGSRIQHL